jgi:endoglucanase
MKRLPLLLIGCLWCISAWSQLPTAQQVAGKMRIGWNLGNTLEAICGENAWGNPNTTQRLIDSVKAAGFNTVRIPCAWDCHATNGVINSNWLARVKTVVDYCIRDSLYVILNIHWDGGWLENNVTTTAQASVNAKQQNYWTQIANYFKSYNQHLLFASANEPNVSGSTGMSVLLSYHQTFINAVRATGGNNASRTLVIQGPNTNEDDTYNLMNTMPTDQIANRLMVEVHYYVPWQWCGLSSDASWGKMFYYWGTAYHSTIQPDRNATWGEECEVERLLGLMKSKFIDKGIPVVIGEFEAFKRTDPLDLSLHLASREYFHKYVVKSAVRNGMIPVYWDAGLADSRLFNRSTGAVADQGIINAIMQGMAAGNTYFTFTNRVSGLFINGMNRTSNGSNAGQGQDSGDATEQWFIDTIGSYVILKNRATGLYLDGMGRASNGSIAGQWSCSISSNQQWTIETDGAYVMLKNRGTGLYLDGLGSTSSGANLGQGSYNSSNYNQQWTLTGPPLITSVNKTNYAGKFYLFPNPFSSAINISITEPQNILSIVVSDIAGRQVEIIEHDHITYEQIIGSRLSPGIYVVQINTLQSSQSFKVIKY